MKGDADALINTDLRRGRFIAPTADLSASVVVPMSLLIYECPLSALIGITLSHKDRQEAVGVTFMVTRRGWVRGPIPCYKRHEQAARPIPMLP